MNVLTSFSVWSRVLMKDRQVDGACRRKDHAERERERVGGGEAPRGMEWSRTGLPKYTDSFWSRLDRTSRVHNTKIVFLLWNGNCKKKECCRFFFFRAFVNGHLVKTNGEDRRPESPDSASFGSIRETKAFNSRKPKSAAVIPTGTAEQRFWECSGLGYRKASHQVYSHAQRC